MQPSLKASASVTLFLAPPVQGWHWHLGVYFGLVPFTAAGRWWPTHVLSHQGGHRYLPSRVPLVNCVFEYICDHPLEILWPFHRFWSILSLHISMSRGKRGKEWWRTALYTFLALYTICYTSPLLNCYTQYSYHSLWVFIKICLKINAVLVQNNCF